MERVPVVLTGRLGATAWRLAGARTRIVTPATAAAAFDEACASAPLVLIDATVARLLPPARLAATRRGERPLVLVVPVADGGDGVAEPHAAAHVVPDVVDVVRRALGVAT
jgi:vacuolar-type H+-ATPase subunit F/Vma7